MQKKLEKFCFKYNLGRLSQSISKVSGGLLHQMYRVKTTQGEFAIKILNPNIMKRSTALSNMIHSELVANQLKDIVPLVAARSIEGNYVVEFEGLYYMVFDWHDGESIFSPEITKEHCRQIGDALGKIHAANVHVAGIVKDQNSRDVYDWVMYLEDAKVKSVECYQLLKDSLSDIRKWDEGVVNSWDRLSKCQVISHRDLDPKNVLWKDNLACIIDWESAGYVNPYQELIEVLNYWIVGEDGNLDKEKFEALMTAYTEYMSIREVDWQVVQKCSYDGMLGWLEYSIKRALGLEGDGPLEKEEGLNQTKVTIQELKRYESRMNMLFEWIRTF